MFRLFLLLSLVLLSSAAEVEGKDATIEGWFDSDLHRVPLTEKQKTWFKDLGKREPIGSSLLTPECARQEYRNLTNSERRMWHNAIRAMKNTMIDGQSEYDIFVTFHDLSQSPAAHSGAAFLPWHREYLFRMERALRIHDPYTCLPYWDTTLEGWLPTFADSAIWTTEYLGESQGVVVTGPFESWSVLPQCQSEGQELTRNVGQAGKPMHDDDLDHVFNQTHFQEIVCNVDCRLEDDNWLAHQFVGGHMSDQACSPSDPVFWLHHAFIDLIWEEFRNEYQVTDPEVEYPSHVDGITDIGGDQHNPFSVMAPFEYLVNIHGLSDHYTNYYYHYTPRPIFCQEEEDCGGEYIWCDVTESRCKAKVMLWGDCTGFPDEACACTGECIPEDDSNREDPECLNNVCVI